MESAYVHKQVVDNYLQEELSLGRVAGPFAHSLVSHGWSDQQIWSNPKTSQTKLMVLDN